MNLLVYFQKGCIFHKISACNCPQGVVVLIHGWGVRSDSMRKIAACLLKNNFEVYNYDYPSSKFSIDEHAEIFISQFRELLADTQLPIYFVTHSMGGLIFRCVFDKLNADERKRINSIVMLGPPNNGSFWGRFGDNRLVRKFNASLGDMSDLPHSFVNNISTPENFPVLGIIGGNFDLKVAHKSLLINANIPQKITFVNCSHPGLRISKQVQTLILRFLKSGNF